MRSHKIPPVCIGCGAERDVRDVMLCNDDGRCVSCREFDRDDKEQCGCGDIDCPGGERCVNRGDWWCPTCGKWVAGKDVTYYQHHDRRASGCGELVMEKKPDDSYRARSELELIVYGHYTAAFPNSAWTDAAAAVDQMGYGLNTRKQQVENLAMFVVRFVSRCRRGVDMSDLAEQAKSYLREQGLNPAPFKMDNSPEFMAKLKEIEDGKQETPHA